MSKIKQSLKVVFVGLLAGLLLLPNFTPVEAATFNKNKLIDDSLFTDTDSMTVAQIQKFLDSHGTLLANWRDDVHMRRPGDNCVVHHATYKTAAQIIYEAANGWGAQVYNSKGCAIRGAYWHQAAYSGYKLKTISPKAILVTLQKEQSLISANGTYSKNSSSYKNPACCSSNSYKLAYAMGYGVPDSGSINKKYIGFYNQVNWAAWQLRYNYERSGGNTGWDGVGSITYSGPMTKGTHRRCSSCSLQYFDGYYPIDGKSLYIANRATAALYYYTPHTYPGYYGNYNFVQYYSDWFGPPLLPTYKAKLLGKSSGVWAKPGFESFVWFKYRNVGTATWYDLRGAPANSNPVVMAATRQLYRNSLFNGQFAREDKPNVVFSTVYHSDGKTVSNNQHRALPTQIVTFGFKLVTPMDVKSNTTYKEWFEPVRLMDRTMSGASSVSVTIPSLSIKSKLISKTSYRGVKQGWNVPAYIKIKNTGNVTWYDQDANPEGVESIILKTTRKPIFGSLYRNGYLVSNNISKVYSYNGTSLAPNQSIVRPGQTAVFRFTMKVPANLKPGIYTESFKPLFYGAPSVNLSDSIPIKLRVYAD